MKNPTVKLFFFLFLFMMFLSGGYFYTLNRAPYAYAYTYAESMKNQTSEEDYEEDLEEDLEEDYEEDLEEDYEEDLEEEQTMYPTTTPPTNAEIDDDNNYFDLESLPNKGVVEDSNRDNPPYNANMYYGFDPTSQYVGMYTDIDKLHDSTSFSELSDNPMDSNWGGVAYTRNQVDSGKYDGNLVMPLTQSNGFGISTRVNKQPTSVFA